MTVGVIISVHIRKCAGTTLRLGLEQCLGPRVLFDYGDEIGSSWPSSVAKRTRRLAKAQSRPRPLVRDFDLIHGHFYRSKYDFLPGPRRYMTFLRDPVQRVLSNYFYLKRNLGRQNPDSILVNRLGFSLLEFAQHADNQNLQSQYLQSETLDGLDFVGIVENYADSVARMNARLELQVPVTDAHNVNAEAQGDYTVSPKDRAVIEDCNRVDLRLYEAARSRLAAGPVFQ